jgi:hypothetical protein
MAKMAFVNKGEPNREDLYLNEIGIGTICTPCTQLIAQPGNSGLTL